MGSLTATLSTATQSLLAQEEALSVTNNNIANANTAGYAREIVTLSEAAPTQSGNISLGNGVNVSSVSSVQDQFLTLAIQAQTSSQSSATAQANTLNAVQTLFPSSGAGLSTALSSFYTSLSALSSSPSNTADRQTVIANAGALVAQFNAISAGLSSPPTSLNTQVQSDVSQINALLTQVSSLNAQITAAAGSGQTSATLSDQLGQAETQLAGLINISVIQGANGTASITTANGTPLVEGNQSYALSTTTNSSGNVQVLDDQGNNITATITGGDLGGTIQVRDTALPALQTSLDALANQVATTFNTAQAQGYNANGTAGTALFTVNAAVSGSAASISLATTDPNAIAASSDGTAGSNGNVANLAAAQTSATTASSSLLYQVGTLTAAASAQVTTTGLALTSLSNQLSSVSGVSTDEETANLVRFQQAYQAAAKVISTLAEIFSTTINMIPNS